jgi:tetraacyldisaccharide 4'-kinase
MPTTLKPLKKNLFTHTLAGIYATAIAIRNAWYNTMPGSVVPGNHLVISIGGIHAGGTGKTPLSLLVGDHFRQAGFTVVFLSRGYGRRLKKDILVRPGSRHSWEEIGDEPALLHQKLPQAWLGIGANRTGTARALASLIPKKSVYILDDGFQHRQLARSIDIVCLPADPFASSLIPTGCLREPIANLRRATHLCLVGTRDEHDQLLNSRAKLLALYPEKPIYCLYQHPVGWTHLHTGQQAEIPPPRHPALVCGIAHPQRFLAMVESLGLNPLIQRIYEDHHIYSEQEIQALMTPGNQPSPDGILTTHKDACRLSTLGLVMSLAIWYLSIQLRFFDDASRSSFLNGLMGHQSTL